MLVYTIYSKRKTITVRIDGKSSDYVTYKNSVKELLASKSITLGTKDKINVPLDSKLNNDQVINIKKAVNVNLEYDGKYLEIKSSDDDVASLLKNEGISVNSQDKLFPDRSTKVTEGLKIKIVRVTSKTFSKTKSIDYKKITKKNKKLLRSVKKILQRGKAGKRKIVTQIVYEDGKKVSSKVVSNKIVKKPKSTIVVLGTRKPTPKPSTPTFSRGGISMAYRNVLTMRATAYSGGVGTYTASGRRAVRNSGGYSTIAVDPSIIPYGTRLYIQGYGFAIAADTGSAIRGNKIDVYFNSYREACHWGVKYIRVYVLK
ncbi:3D domain-containing protein [Clostridium oryzae]|uniref:Cell wall-binding protein YocH n=1 Tax=Clostridium oryzae TaxID=1450648 RepID=A0A1V4IQT4_9CLOT|nr:3D domain-containing protein [Clostridium oryzae]OPJ62296.1 cell wall-binding protein YocH precursor [Clostridium oryzae]